MYANLNWVLDAASDDPKGDIITISAKEILGSRVTAADIVRLYEVLGARRVVDLVLIPRPPHDHIDGLLEELRGPKHSDPNDGSGEDWVVDHTFRLLEAVEQMWEEPDLYAGYEDRANWERYVGEQRGEFVAWRDRLAREWPGVEERLDQRRAGFILMLESIHARAAADLARAPNGPVAERRGVDVLR